MKLVINAIMTRPGGALTVLLGFLRAWRQADLMPDVTILASQPGTLERLSSANLNYAIEPIAAGAGAARRVWWQTTRLGGWLTRAGADVVLTNNHFLSGVPCPQVVHHHNLWRFVTDDLGVPPGRGIVDRMRDWFARRALREAAANVFVSHFLREQAEQFEPASRARNHVVPNCIDDERLADGASLATAIGPRLIAVQNANPHKDNPTLIRALAELVRLSPDVPWRLQVAGSAGRAAWQPYQDLARQLGVFERIDWLGFLNGTELAARQREAHCLLSTSRFESSGLPVIEAFAAGCPVVGSSIPAFAEYAGDAAELVPAGDAEAFARGALKLWSEPELRRERIERGLARAGEYRWSAWAPELARIIENGAHGPAGS